jgi:hypothetical protein
VYISEVGGRRVRMIRDRQVSTVAASGDGAKGFADGPAAQSLFNLLELSQATVVLYMLPTPTTIAFE